MSEPHEVRLKRLAMRSMRRGIKEMDLILSRFAETALPGMSDDSLDLYERLLEENDHDLYQWVSGQSEAPDVYGPLVQQIAAGADGIVRPA
ncbi:MAG: succinate dehydrogenase assembly factor 2 [Paracoccaceae bacterium]